MKKIIAKNCQKAYPVLANEGKAANIRPKGQSSQKPGTRRQAVGRQGGQDAEPGEEEKSLLRKREQGPQRRLVIRTGWPGPEGVPAQMAACDAAGREAAGGGDESAARLDDTLDQAVIPPTFIVGPGTETSLALSVKVAVSSCLTAWQWIL